MNCWICKKEITHQSKEHLIKRSDLKQTFGHSISQQSPIYVRYNSDEKSKIVGSLKSDKFKSETPICGYCNNTRTQPHDKSWSEMSSYLYKLERHPPHRLKANNIFKSNSTSILGVHLFFAKNLGFRILDNDIPIDVSPLSTAIVEGRACNNLYLSIGFLLRKRQTLASAGGTEIHGIVSNQEIYSLNYTYWIGRIFVDVIYSIKPLGGLRVSYNPRRPSKIIKLNNYI